MHCQPGDVFASVGQSGRIDAFLKRAYKFGFSKDIITFNELNQVHHCSLKCSNQYIVKLKEYVVSSVPDIADNANNMI